MTVRWKEKNRVKERHISLYFRKQNDGTVVSEEQNGGTANY